MKRRLLIMTAVIALAGLAPLIAVGQTADELQSQIEEHNSQIAQLDKEIAQYESQLTSVSNQKQTLQNTLKQLDLSRKKITASISATKKRIATTGLEIIQLSKGIAVKERSIRNDELGLEESLRTLNDLESRPLVMQVLTSSNISEAWREADAIAQLQSAVRNDISTLAKEKKSLTQTKDAQEEKRAQLKRQQATLVAQQGSLDATRRAQNELLSQTKAQESNYQAILAQKQAAKANFESALQDLQSKLQYTIDPSKITPGGKGILNWPIDNVRVTQNFGNTQFALSGAYKGKGHNGIDLKAPIGTPIRAALTGTVISTGDTGSVRGCYSYGRWVLIKHGNGLDTLYAHLSQIGAFAGQSVATGQIIGYSGQTGYATGPHLHFGVYVSSATQVMRLGDATNQKTACANAVMPIAPLSAYLNPMNYL